MVEYGITLGAASGGAGGYGGGFGGMANFVMNEPIGMFAVGGAVALIILIVSLR